MELRELRTDLGALVIGGEEYIQTLNRINQIQSQLDLDPLDPTGRKAQIRSRLGTLGRFGARLIPSRSLLPEIAGVEKEELCLL